MVIYENINENKIDKQIAKLKSKLLSGIFIKLKTLAPAKAGIDKRKEILAASTLLNFENELNNDNNWRLGSSIIFNYLIGN